MTSKSSKLKPFDRVPLGAALSPEVKKRAERSSRDVHVRRTLEAIFECAAWLQPIAQKEAAAGVQDAAAALAWLDRMSGASLVRILQSDENLREQFKQATGHALPAVDTSPQLGWSQSDEA